MPENAAEPAITKESVHHFSKLVAGLPLKRPLLLVLAAADGPSPTATVELTPRAALSSMALTKERSPSALRVKSC